jgi:nucleoside-diphosphate-sugar epimerase
VSKALAEEVAWTVARERGLALTVVRPSGILGPRDQENAPQFRFWMRFPLLPAPSFVFPFSHANDIARGICAALARDASIGKAYNLAGDPVTIRDVLRAWKRATGRGPWLLPLWSPFGLIYSHAAARAELGFENRPLDETMRDAVEVG